MPFHIKLNQVVKKLEKMEGEIEELRKELQATKSALENYERITRDMNKTMKLFVQTISRGGGGNTNGS